ncbi:FecR family protein [Spirosoma sp.]|uniref:FecR family protein n=1 Tax=Spirosoma sp. TaxID=1899569 RepID=UPI00260FE4A3|nr:FecR family protein [Spirosoma sp.]MCX6213083.1 FecR domain-containing protein [Spirosoma sp.]
MKSTLSRQTILNSFAGKATPLQKRLIEKWLAEPTHQELYFQWLEEWELENLQLMPDADKAYSRLLQLRQVATTDEEPETNDPTVRQIGNRTPLVWWAAASVAILLAFGSYAFRNQLLYKEYKTTGGEVRRVTLPDQSQAILQANSRLTVARFGFGWGAREVSLVGEAQFSVKHTTDHRRFVVRTPKQLDVQVLGTSFRVMARPQTKTVEVDVSSGKVAVYEHANSTRATAPKRVVLTPNQRVIYNTQVRQLTAELVEHPISLISGDEPVYNDTPIRTIISQLNRQYGITIHIMHQSLEKAVFTGDLSSLSVFDKLNIICQSIHAEYEIVGTEIFINAKRNIPHHA